MQELVYFFFTFIIKHTEISKIVTSFFIYIFYGNKVECFRKEMLKLSTDTYNIYLSTVNFFALCVSYPNNGFAADWSLQHVLAVKGRKQRGLAGR